MSDVEKFKLSGPQEESLDDNGWFVEVRDNLELAGKSIRIVLDGRPVRVTNRGWQNLSKAGGCFLFLFVEDKLREQLHHHHPATLHEFLMSRVGRAILAGLKMSSQSIPGWEGEDGNSVFLDENGLAHQDRLGEKEHISTGEALAHIRGMRVGDNPGAIEEMFVHDLFTQAVNLLDPE